LNYARTGRRTIAKAGVCPQAGRWDGFVAPRPGHGGPHDADRRSLAA